MKIKILFTFLMTLAVVIGVWLYYDSVFSRQSSATDFPAGDLYVTVSSEGIPHEQEVVNNVELPKYKPSSRNISKSLAGTSGLESIIQTPGKTNLNSSKHTGSLSSNAVYPVRVTEENDRMYSSSSSALLAQNSYGTRSRVSGSGEGNGASSSVYSSQSITHLTGPMLAGEAFAENGDPNDGNTNDASSDFLPPEGAPVGQGLIVLLLFAGAYFFYRRKI